MWSETFERDLGDICKLQTEVACAVISAVRPRAKTALLRAIDCLQRAIAHDPDYALAYSGLADASSLASTGYYGELPVTESMAHALPAALQAIELAPMLAEAHA